MNTLLSDKPQNKINLSQVWGTMGFMDEGDYEKEDQSKYYMTRALTSTVNTIAESILSLGQAAVGSEQNTDTEANRLSIGGKTELKFDENQAKIAEEEKKRKEADRKKIFYQALKDDQLRTQQAKDRMWLEEEINDITTNLSTEDKNELLNLQASYKNNKSTYHRAELRRKLIEKRKKSETQQKQAQIPSPAKQPSALEGVFEGRSGTQGTGTANLSAHATG